MLMLERPLSHYWTSPLIKKIERRPEVYLKSINIGLWSLKYWMASVSTCDYKAIIVIIVSSKPLLWWFIIWIKTCNSGNKCRQKLKVYMAMDAFEKLNGTKFWTSSCQ